MKLKYNFVVNKVADKTVAVVVGADSENFNGFIKLDDLGAFMFDLLKEETTAEEMAVKMQAQYPDATKEEIDACIEDFVSRLKAEGIVE